MNTTNVESNNLAKGPVVIAFVPGQKDLEVVQSGKFTDDFIQEFGGQVIGIPQTTHNIIDDNNKGFKIIEDGENKRVDEIEAKRVKQMIERLKATGAKMLPVKQSEIDLIEKATGYKLVIKDKSMIIDDVQEER